MKKSGKFEKVLSDFRGTHVQVHVHVHVWQNFSYRLKLFYLWFNIKLGPEGPHELLKAQACGFNQCFSVTQRNRVTPGSKGH